MTVREFYLLVKDTYTAWNQDKAPRLGAALSYYAVFSLAPLMLVVIAVASLLLGKQAAQGEVFRQLQSVMGAQAALAIQELLAARASQGATGSIGSAIMGFGVVLIGAGALFGQLQDSLNTIWKSEKPPTAGLVAMLKLRFLSFFLVLFLGALMVLSLMLSVAVTTLSTHMGPWAGLAAAGNFVVSFSLFFVLIMAIFRILPDVELAWRDVGLGALLTTVLFVVGKSALSWYLARPGTASASGSAGALIILLLWIYYSAQILFLGAEFTKVFAHRFGSRPRHEAAAETPVAQIGLPVSGRPVNLTAVKNAQFGIDAPGLLFVGLGGALAVLWVYLQRKRAG